jgi:predicted metal-dependent peptidase
MNHPDLQRRINRARWWAISEQPFYGQLCAGLEDGFEDVGTACTDGRSIRWDPKFLAGLADEQIRAVLIHEALHCGHGHLWRLPIDDTANTACDYVVNDIIAQIPGCKLPKGALMCPPVFKDKSEEEIYQALKASERPRKGPNGKKPGNGPGIGDFSAPAQSQEDGKPSLKEEWEQRVIQAAQAQQASGQGSIPTDMARELARRKAQRLDWRQEMADFVRQAMGERNDWSRSNRRSAIAPVIYPRKRRDKMATVVFARDTSGSISDAQAAEFSAVIDAVLADVGCDGIVLDCDAAIQASYRLAPGEPCPLTAKGGGGTDFRPVFDFAASLETLEHVAGVVYLTDLDGQFPESSDLPTLWISTTDKTAPFGRTVKL